MGEVMQEKKIKICALTTISKTMDWFIVDSMRNLSKNGYDITLISNMEEEFINKNSDFAKCINLPMTRGVSIKNLIKTIRSLKKIFKREKFDIIYYTTPNASMYAAIAGKSTGIKLRIYNQCGLRYVSFKGVKRRIFKWIEKLTCKKSTHVRSQSPMNMEYAINEGLCSKEKISVVGIGGTIGVDLKECDSFDHVDAKSSLREKYCIPQDAFVYGYVGRINKDKGINELIQAFHQVAEKKEKTYLVMVGMKDDANPITPQNMKIAEEHERIIMTGNVPKEEVYSHMAVFDVLVHPTYREGFGKVLQEAMGMNLPIITTNVPGPSEVVNQGECGLLVEVQNVEDLTQKMIEIYEDDALRVGLSQKGRERAEKYFDRPIMLNNILEDMNRIAGES